MLFILRLLRRLQVHQDKGSFIPKQKAQVQFSVELVAKLPTLLLITFEGIHLNED